MKIINGIVLFVLFCCVLLLCAFTSTGDCSQYDIIECDMEKEYFVYIDNEENIERVSLNEDIEIMTSDKNYVRVSRTTYFDVFSITRDIFTTTKYDLYLNTSTINN